jgi:type II secretory pathway pseudopilin PulG
MRLAMRLRERLRSDSGVTLVEVVVVCGLLTIVLGFILQGFVSMQRAFQGDENRLETLDQARQLMDIMSKDLRTATSLTAGTDPFQLADSREIRFYANLNNPNGTPNLIHIYVRSTDNALIEESTPPDSGSCTTSCTYNNGPTTVRLVGQYVANSTTPIFTYYDANGNALSPTPLSGTNQLAVQSIQITLQIRKSTSLAVPSTTLINEVTLPNVYLTVNPTPSASP